MKNSCNTLFKLWGDVNVFKKYYVEIRNKYPEKIFICLDICPK